MNNSIYFDLLVSDDERRDGLFEGQIYVYSPCEATIALCDFAKDLIQEHFEGMEPRTAQYHLSVEDYAERLGRLKPRFIHHPESKRLVRRVLEHFSVDTDLTYCDVPKMRSSTSDGYLTTGIAYAWHPHRDTWYSAPMAQINWWTPIFPITAENCMAFHPRYFAEPVANSSDGYNYYEWNAKYRGASVAKLTKSDDRPLPKPTEPLELDPQIRIVCPPGGMIVFSGQHMHSSVPNTSGETRFSIDFRTVHEVDLEQGKGAPNVDVECGGTALRDFLRATDQMGIPEELIAKFDDDTHGRGELVYHSTASA
jgi:hypothetical protein